MEYLELEDRAGIENSPKATKMFMYFKKLISELKKKEIPSNIIQIINHEIERINSFSGSNRELLRMLQRSKLIIIRLLEKELKIVPKNLYRTRWLAIGMVVFGIPFGSSFGLSLDNMAFIGIGLPIGMAIGIAVGAGMDKKAFEEGRQLDIYFES